MTNELANVNVQTGEVMGQVIVNETADYVTVIENGKYVRKAKYTEYSSIVATTREERIWLMNILDGGEENGNGLKDNVGARIEVANVIFRKYDKVNEDTGVLEYGVLTYLFTPEKDLFVTSSKSVYFTVKRALDMFGKPGDELWENLVFEVQKEKGKNGDMIKVKLVG